MELIKTIIRKLFRKKTLAKSTGKTIDRVDLANPRSTLW